MSIANEAVSGIAYKIEKLSEAIRNAKSGRTATQYPEDVIESQVKAWEAERSYLASISGIKLEEENRDWRIYERTGSATLEKDGFTCHVGNTPDGWLLEIFVEDEDFGITMETATREDAIKAAEAFLDGRDVGLSCHVNSKEYLKHMIRIWRRMVSYGILGKAE